MRGHTLAFVGPSMLSVTLCAPAGAAEFTVNQLADETDSQPGDGACASSSGLCSLRAAIQEANALPGADRIVVPGGIYRLTIGGTGEELSATGDLNVTDGVTIVGAGAGETIIDGGAMDRVIAFSLGGPDASAEISGVTIRNGLSRGGGAGIVSSGLNDILSPAPRVTLRNVVLTGNATLAAGGAIANVSLSDMILVGVTIADNWAREGGGGISNEAATMTIVASLVTRNSTAGVGGGIATFADRLTTGRVDVVYSTISDNEAASDGGGISSGGDLRLLNTTVSGNSTEERGGGIHAVPLSTVLILNSTITDNSAQATGGGIHNFESTSDKFKVGNSIVGSNRFGGDCGESTVVSLGHNLDGDGSCGLGKPTDLSRVNPMLGLLGYHGGPTPTHLLLPFSPGVDRIPPESCIQTDQRGKPRSVDGNGDGAVRCDIGAVEYQAREPDSCNLNGNGIVDRDDHVQWFLGCRAGTSRWLCDVDGNGFFELADLVAHIMICARLPQSDSQRMAEEIENGN